MAKSHGLLNIYIKDNFLIFNRALTISTLELSFSEDRGAMQAHNNITEHMISRTGVQSAFTTHSLSGSTAMTLPPCIHMTYVLKCNQPQHVSPSYNKFSLNPKTTHENVVSLLESYIIRI